MYIYIFVLLFVSRIEFEFQYEFQGGYLLLYITYFCQNFQILKRVQLTVKIMEYASSHILMASPVTALEQDTLEQHVKVSA